jgi:hypothetical protein
MNARRPRHRFPKYLTVTYGGSEWHRLVSSGSWVTLTVDPDGWALVAYRGGRP